MQPLVDDSAATVGQSVQTARQLVNRYKVHFLMGAVSSAVAEALSQAANDLRTLYLNTGGHADAVIDTTCRWNTFRPCSTPWLLTAGDVAVTLNTIFDKVGRTWYFITPDYAYGHALHRDYLAQLKKAGGTSLGDALAPVGTTDFSSYPIKAKSANPDALIALTGGDDLINIRKQATRFGLNKAMGVAGPLMEMEVLQPLPGAARYGYWNMEWYRHQPNRAHVTAFVEKYKKANQNKRLPPARSGFGYACAHALALAANQANSLDTMRGVKALEGLELAAEVALPPHKAVYRAADRPLTGSEFPGRIKSGGTCSDLFNVTNVVNAHRIARCAREKGCKMTYPS